MFKKISSFLLLNFCSLAISSADSPYAPTQIGISPSDDSIAKYFYDSSGNRLSNTRTEQTIVMGLMGKPIKITGSEGQEFFRYSTSHSRFLRNHADGRKTLYIRGKEYRINASGQASAVVKVRAKGYSPVVQVEMTEDANLHYTYFVRDHLGSPIVSINDSDSTIHRRYEPWGQSVNAEGVAQTFGNDPETAEAIPGFTGHELIASANSVHMNGRVYDPVAGLFTQPDPVLNTPLSLPTLNRYTYILNNTLFATDPTGYVLERDPNDPRAQIMQVAKLDPEKVVLQGTEQVRWDGFKFDRNGRIIAGGFDHNRIAFVANLRGQNLNITNLHLASASDPRERFAPRGTGAQVAVEAIDLSEKRLNFLPITTITVHNITEKSFKEAVRGVSFLEDVENLPALHSKIIDTFWGNLIKNALDRKGYTLVGHQLTQTEDDLEWVWRFDVRRKGPYHPNTLEPPALDHNFERHFSTESGQRAMEALIGRARRFH